MQHNDLGEKIKQLRLKKQITQKDLASQLNMANTTISNWENGYRMPSLSDLRRLASFFEVTLSYFESETNPVNDMIIDDLDIKHQVIDFKPLLQLISLSDQIIFLIAVLMIFVSLFIRLPITFGLMSIGVFLLIYLWFELIRRDYLRRRTTHKKILAHINDQIFYIHKYPEEKIIHLKQRMRLITLFGLTLTLIFAVNASMMILSHGVQTSSMLLASMMLLLVMSVLGVYRFIESPYAFIKEINYHQALRDLKQPLLFIYLLFTLMSLVLFASITSYRSDLYPLNILVITTGIIVTSNILCAYFLYQTHHSFILGYRLYARNPLGIDQPLT
jgi:transcriptional regulator with XRE-family HTH domain